MEEISADDLNWASVHTNDYEHSDIIDEDEEQQHNEEEEENEND